MQDEHSTPEPPRDSKTSDAASTNPPGDKPRPAETPSRQGCLRWGLVILAFLMTAPCLCCCGGWLYWNRQAQQAAEAELALIREAGEPVEIADLKSITSRTGGESDAADLWRQAFEELDAPAFVADSEAIPQLFSNGTYLPTPHAYWPDEDAAAQFLGDHADLLELLHQASQQGTGEFDISYTKGGLMEFKYLSSAQRAFRLLKLKAYYDAHTGDTAGAAGALRDTLSMAALLQQQPSFIPQLVAAACIGSVWSSLQDLMPGNEWGEQDLLATQEALRGLDPKAGLKTALLGERVLAIYSFSFVEDISQENPEDGRIEVKRHEDLAYTLKNFRELVAATDLPWPALLASGKTLESQMKQETSGLGGVRYVVTATVFPPVSVVLVAGARTEAFLATARAGIALERFRQQTGAFPQTLAELAPDWLPTVPLDPFDGQSLRYHPPANETDYATVFSVGENIKDDGANPSDDADGIPLDLVFRVSTPPKNRSVPPAKE
ncbi:hypothetical protein [Lignipirellula cremea]|uniref:Bacterial type II secretion system protein G n=1 Tax=Lignipirellula cremea TaxID=2528010 RepID=A0A518DTY2_9BACT|nr:hypothetical protein [Lignipirellula cremea]QDU95295.1 hypothetical protein Pla8534_31100 [Lignipirellula cremea]